LRDDRSVVIAGNILCCVASNRPWTACIKLNPLENAAGLGNIAGVHPEVPQRIGQDHMRELIYSDDVIEAMVEAMCSGKVSQRDQDIYREALRGLVRLGQAEQLLSMQLDFNSMTMGPAGPVHQH
jgi:hypothetical protein